MATDYIYIALRKSPELLKLFDLSSDFLVYGAICLFYATFLILGLQKKKFIVTELTTIDCEFLRNYLLKEKINSEVYRIDLRKISV